MSSAVGTRNPTDQVCNRQAMPLWALLRWQVEHVAGFQIQDCSAWNRLSMRSGAPSITSRSSWALDFPAAPPLALDQEHIVGIECGPTPPGRCEAHHQVVQAGERNEIEGMQQRIAFRQEEIHPGDQAGLQFFFGRLARSSAAKGPWSSSTGRA